MTALFMEYIQGGDSRIPSLKAVGRANMAALTTALAFVLARPARKRRVFAEGKEPVMANMDAKTQQEVLDIEEASAWNAYLDATHGQTPSRYAEVEPWAWAELSQRRRAIKRRRSELAELAPAAA